MKNQNERCMSVVILLFSSCPQWVNDNAAQKKLSWCNRFLTMVGKFLEGEKRLELKQLDVEAVKKRLLNIENLSVPLPRSDGHSQLSAILLERARQIVCAQVATLSMQSSTSLAGALMKNELSGFMLKESKSTRRNIDLVPSDALRYDRLYTMPEYKPSGNAPVSDDL